MKVLIFDDMSRCTEAEVQRMLPLVNAQRREQALRYKHIFGQFCCLKSRLMLQELVDESMQDADFLYNEQGKPYWEHGPYFSISHCKEGIAVVVGDEPVGIDIEGIRHADADLIRRTMNEREQEQITSDRAFTRLWTQKEAVVKWQGVGIAGFEQLQTLLIPSYDLDVTKPRMIETFEKENYIYSIAYGKLHCFRA